MVVSKIQKQILRSISSAQVASDAAKGIRWNSEECPTRSEWYRGYDAKLLSIIRAIKMIDSNPPCGITYYVVEADDQNGYPSVIVYFTVKIHSKMQISFHTPYNKAKPLMRWIGKGSPCRWDKRRGGSREDSKQIIKEFGL